MTEDIVSTLRPITVVVSKDQKAIEIPEAMVIEKKLPDLLSLLESHARGCYPRNSCGTQASDARSLLLLSKLNQLTRNERRVRKEEKLCQGMRDFRRNSS